MVMLFLNPNSNLYLSSVFDGCIIIETPGLFLQRVPTTVKSSASSYSAKGMLVKKLSIVMFRPIKNKVMLIYCLVS